MGTPGWDHNVHYHSLLLRHCPRNAQRILEIGCGHGHFAHRLAERAEIVDALDVDAAVLKEAETKAIEKNIRFICDDFLKADLPEGQYDVVVAIAALHHMELSEALEKMKRLLRPGGTIAILGLYKEKALTDLFFAVASVPLNWFYLCRHWRAGTKPARTVRTCPPGLTLAQIRSAALLSLPGARIRRHLLWRYSLIWTR